MSPPSRSLPLSPKCYHSSSHSSLLKTRRLIRNGIPIFMEAALHFLVPTWWEVEITAAAAVFVIIAYWLFTYGSGEIDENQIIGEGLIGAGDVTIDKLKVKLVDFSLLGLELTFVYLIFLFSGVVFGNIKLIWKIIYFDLLCGEYRSNSFYIE